MTARDGLSYDSLAYRYPGLISETVDPTTGYAHIAYADGNAVNKLRVANQISGSRILRP